MLPKFQVWLWVGSGGRRANLSQYKCSCQILIVCEKLSSIDRAGYRKHKTIRKHTPRTFDSSSIFSMFHVICVCECYSIRFFPIVPHFRNATAVQHIGVQLCVCVFMWKNRCFCSQFHNPLIYISHLLLLFFCVFIIERRCARAFTQCLNTYRHHRHRRLCTLFFFIHLFGCYSSQSFNSMQ